MLNVVINGFGCIGRAVFKIVAESSDLGVVDIE
jgi:glyceraldehyde-3-phosphate dehydrogenase/erythrose-4-phosphate dehydrogenase